MLSPILSLIKEQKEAIRIGLLNILGTLDIDKIDAPGIKITKSKGQKVVVVDDMEKIPNKYKKFVITLQGYQWEAIQDILDGSIGGEYDYKEVIDKKSILAEFDNGLEIDGTHISQATRLTIKEK